MQLLITYVIGYNMPEPMEPSIRAVKSGECGSGAAVNGDGNTAELVQFDSDKSQPADGALLLGKQHTNTRLVNVFGTC